MQGKGLIKLFLILLIIVSIVQFMYLIPTNKVEKEALEHAEMVASSVSEEERSSVMSQAKAAYLDSISDDEIFSIPLLKSYTYSELKAQQLAFGLDLQGGMSAVLQVDLKELMVSLSNNNKDRTFRDALDKASIAQKSSQSNFVTLFYEEYQKISEGKKLSKIFNRAPVLGENINLDTDDGEVIRLLREKSKETVKLTFQRLKERIDGLGVAQPNVSLDEARDLIMVEVPGIENPKRLRDLLESTAKLEFMHCYHFDDPGIRAAFQQADRRLKELEGVEEQEVALDSVFTYEYDSLGNTIDSVLTLQDSDPLLSQGPLMSKLAVNGINGAANFYGPIVGVADKNQRNEVMRMLSIPEIKALFPADGNFRWSKKPYVAYEDDQPVETDQYELYLVKKQPGSSRAELEGDVVVKATQGPDPQTGQQQVSLQMNAKGAKKWAEMTDKAFKTKRSIAILLDDQVATAPGVSTGAITGGNSSITGNFSTQEAVDLANVLEIGKLPAQVEIIQESIVGPYLGQKNITASRNSLIAGLLIVMLFMMLYYGGAGIVSILSLIANIIFIFGALASFGTVLTVPGIAGIVLTIGMAVDANVIIFERVREELRSGKSLQAAIKDGFGYSYSAIIDANVTTILVAFVLAYFGLGPIKGFAVVLIIGVLSSLFTAVLLGRLIIDWWTGKGRSISFWTGWSKNMFANMQVDWLGKRKIAYIISGVFIAAGLVSMFTKKFDLGVDFQGGYQYTVQFNDHPDVERDGLTAGLAEVFGSTPVVKAVDSDNTFNITTDYEIDNTDKDAHELVMAKFFEGIQNITGATNLSLADFENSESNSGTKVISSTKVGPTIADDIKNSSFKAGIFALLLIFLYIFIRFNKWQYSLGAVSALLHDSLVVLGIFSMLWGILPFSMEIDQAFIAAILTVIGYSINDTVVVFDRIREYLGIYTKKSTDDVLNMAINSTFSRTIITSLTTLLVIGILFVFGGSSIKGFAFALLIGVLVGTYSSIFVATPIVRDLSDDLKVKAAVTKGTKKESFSRRKTS